MHPAPFNLSSILFILRMIGRQMLDLIHRRNITDSISLNVLHVCKQSYREGRPEFYCMHRVSWLEQETRNLPWFVPAHPLWCQHFPVSSQPAVSVNTSNDATYIQMSTIYIYITYITKPAASVYLWILTFPAVNTIVSCDEWYPKSDYSARSLIYQFFGPNHIFTRLVSGLRELGHQQWRDNTVVQTWHINRKFPFTLSLFLSLSCLAQLLFFLLDKL
jgi:hypothetical protein